MRRRSWVLALIVVALPGMPLVCLGDEEQTDAPGQTGTTEPKPKGSDTGTEDDQARKREEERRKKYQEGLEELDPEGYAVDYDDDGNRHTYRVDPDGTRSELSADAQKSLENYILKDGKKELQSASDEYNDSVGKKDSEDVEAAKGRLVEAWERNWAALRDPSGRPYESAQEARKAAEALTRSNKPDKTLLQRPEQRTNASPDKSQRQASRPTQESRGPGAKGITQRTPPRTAEVARREAAAVPRVDKPKPPESQAPPPKPARDSDSRQTKPDAKQRQALDTLRKKPPPDGTSVDPKSLGLKVKGPLTMATGPDGKRGLSWAADGRTVFESLDGLVTRETGKDPKTGEAIVGTRYRDTAGRPTKEVFQRGDLSSDIRYEYDAQGRLIGQSVTDHRGGSATGSKESRFNPATGALTSLVEKDGEGRPVKETRLLPGGKVEIQDHQRKITFKGTIGADGNPKIAEALLPGGHAALFDKDGKLVGAQLRYFDASDPLESRPIPQKGELLSDIAALQKAGLLKATDAQHLSRAFEEVLSKLGPGDKFSIKPTIAFSGDMKDPRSHATLLYEVQTRGGAKEKVSFGFDWSAGAWTQSRTGATQSGEPYQIISRSSGFDGTRFTKVEEFAATKVQRYVPANGWQDAAGTTYTKMHWDSAKGQMVVDSHVAPKDDTWLNSVTKNIAWSFENLAGFKQAGQAAGVVAGAGQMWGYGVAGNAAKLFGALSGSEEHTVFGIVSEAQAAAKFPGVDQDTVGADMMNRLRSSLGQDKFAQLRQSLVESYKDYLKKGDLTPDRYARLDSLGFKVSDKELAEFLLRGDAGLGIAGAPKEAVSRAAASDSRLGAAGHWLLAASVYGWDFTAQSIGFNGLATGFKTAGATAESIRAARQATVLGQAAAWTERGVKTAEFAQSAYFKMLMGSQALELASALQSGDTEKALEASAQFAGLGLMPQGERAKPGDTAPRFDLVRMARETLTTSPLAGVVRSSLEAVRAPPAPGTQVVALPGRAPVAGAGPVAEGGPAPVAPPPARSPAGDIAAKSVRAQMAQDLVSKNARRTFEKSGLTPDDAVGKFLERNPKVAEALDRYASAVAGKDHAAVPEAMKTLQRALASPDVRFDGDAQRLARLQNNLGSLVMKQQVAAMVERAGVRVPGAEAWGDIMKQPDFVRNAQFAMDLARSGHSVEFIPRGEGKTADLLVNGERLEIKDVRGKDIARSIREGVKQANGDRLLVDFSGTSFSIEEAQQALVRSKGYIDKDLGGKYPEPKEVLLLAKNGRVVRGRVGEPGSVGKWDGIKLVDIPGAAPETAPGGRGPDQIRMGASPEGPRTAQEALAKLTPREIAAVYDRAASFEAYASRAGERLGRPLSAAERSSLFDKWAAKQEPSMSGPVRDFIFSEGYDPGRTAKTDYMMKASEGRAELLQRQFPEMDAQALHEHFVNMLANPQKNHCSLEVVRALQKAFPGWRELQAVDIDARNGKVFTSREISRMLDGPGSPFAKVDNVDPRMLTRMLSHGDIFDPTSLTVVNIQGYDKLPAGSAPKPGLQLLELTDPLTGAKTRIQAKGHTEAHTFFPFSDHLQAKSALEAYASKFDNLKVTVYELRGDAAGPRVGGAGDPHLGIDSAGPLEKAGEQGWKDRVLARARELAGRLGKPAGSSGPESEKRPLDNKMVDKRELAGRLGVDPSKQPRGRALGLDDKPVWVDEIQGRDGKTLVRKDFPGRRLQEDAQNELFMRQVVRAFPEFADRFDTPDAAGYRRMGGLGGTVLVMEKAPGVTNAHQFERLPTEQKAALAVLARAFGWSDVNSGAIVFGGEKPVLLDFEQSLGKVRPNPDVSPSAVLPEMPWVSQFHRNQIGDYLKPVKEFQAKFARPETRADLKRMMLDSGMSPKRAEAMLAVVEGNVKSLERTIQADIDVANRYFAENARRAGLKPAQAEILGDINRAAVDSPEGGRLRDLVRTLNKDIAASLGKEDPGRLDFGQRTLNPGELEFLLRNRPEGLTADDYRKAPPGEAKARAELDALIKQSRAPVVSLEDYSPFNTEGSQGVVYQSKSNPEELLKVFTLKGVSPRHVQEAVRAAQGLTQKGVPVVPMEAVELTDGRWGIRMPRVEGEHLGKAIDRLNGGEWVLPEGSEAGKLQDKAFGVLRAIDKETGGLADRRKQGMFDSADDLANFVLTPDGRVVNIDPINMHSLLRKPQGPPEPRGQPASGPPKGAAPRESRDAELVHDLKNAMIPSRGWLLRASRKFGDEAPPELRRDVDRALALGEKGESLARELMERLRAGTEDPGAAAEMSRRLKGLNDELGSLNKRIVGRLEGLAGKESPDWKWKPTQLADTLQDSSQRSEIIAAELWGGDRANGRGPASAHDSVVSALARNRSVLSERGVQWSLDMRVGDGTKVQDPAVLDRALSNLVLNAADAMEGSPARNLTVKARESADSRRLVLEVSDTGPGMAPELVEAIRGGKSFTTKGPGKGSGVGLPSVRAAVLEAGGTFEVESAPGKGATFRIEIPLVGAR